MPPKNRIILPVSGQFELTEECNQNCLHCYNYNKDSPKSDYPNPKIIARRICENQIFNITITGGEPFLRKSELIGVAEEFSENNVDFEINTNLTLVSREDLRDLKSYNSNSILTSIHSYKEDLHDKISRKKGAFQSLLKGIDLVKKEDFSIAVNMVVTKLNKEQVFDTGRFLIENFGITSFCATPIICSPEKKFRDLRISIGDYVKALDNLLELNENYGINVQTLNPPLPCIFEDIEKYSHFLNRSCVAARNTFTVSPLGKVKPCSNSNEVYGNILENSLEEILLRMEKWRGEDLIPEECSPCVYVKRCRGGCRVMAASLADFNSPHPFYTKPILTKEDTEKEEINLDIESSVVRLNSGKLRVREEKNGLITAYLNPKTHSLIDKNALEMLRLITSYDGNIGDLSRKYNISLDVLKNFTTFFNKKGFITLEKFK